MLKTKLGPLGVVEKFKFVFKLWGLWPSSAMTSKWSSLLYDVYSVTIHIVFLFMYDLSACVSIFFLKDLQELMNNLCMTLTIIALYGKVLNFRIFLRQIQTVLSMSEDFTLKNEQEIFIANQRISLLKKLAILFFCIANLAAPVNLIGVIMSEEVELPVQAWYPFDWKSNPTTYALLFIYQSVGLQLQANLNVSVDLFTTYLMYVASIKLEILGIRLETLSKFTSEGLINQRVDVEEALVDCVVTYQRCWNYIRQLQKCFTYAFFVQIGLSGTVICSTAYQLTNTSPQENVAAYSFLIMFQLCMVSQVAIPCYFGNEIILKHHCLTGRIFNCGWHLKSIRYRRIVLTFMEIVKRKRYILVGNWFILDLNLFVSIMNFAYRLYTILV